MHKTGIWLVVLLLRLPLWADGERLQPDNLIDNPSFETIQNGNCESWQGVALQASPLVHSGNYAGKVVLSEGDKYVMVNSKPFKVTPGGWYYIDFWFRKDRGFRVIPMIVFQDGATTIAMPGFPELESCGNYMNYFGIVRAPENQAYTTACFRVYMDWFGGDRSGMKMFLIDDIAVHKVEK